MAATNPYRQTDGRPQQPAVPWGRPPSQATPIGPDQPPPQGQPMPSTGPLRAQDRAAPHLPPSVGPAAAGAAVQIVVAEASSGTTSRPAEDSQGGEDLSSVALKNAPPWLLSAAFHMVLLIVLGLLAVAMQDRSQIYLDIQTVYAEQSGDQLQFDSPLGMDNIDQTEEPVLSMADRPEVPDPFAAPASLEILPDGTTVTSDIRASQIGLALEGRQEGSRRSLLGRYGGDATTEAAVQAGLAWLARNQLKNGSWSLAGPYTAGVPDGYDNRAAATAMALLAFQGNGHTHKKGKFRRNVGRGWKWLLRQQDADGNFFKTGGGNHQFYTQAQCTIAICELYAMSKDVAYEEPAERAVQYCLRAQGGAGGWKYSPNARSDLSVTGWVLMGLQSARMAELEVPEDHLLRVERFLDSVAADGGRYRYERGREPSLAMTAEGLLCRQYLGWPRDHPRLVEGVEWITAPANLIDFHRGRDAYYWYYATQVAHHMEGEYWNRWNAVMRQALPEQQLKQGREKGSWDPQEPTMDQWAPHGGRLYVTCLSIYMLEVYYRHLPIYAKIYTNLLKSGRTGVTN